MGKADPIWGADSLFHLLVLYNPSIGLRLTFSKQILEKISLLRWKAHLGWMKRAAYFEQIVCYTDTGIDRGIKRYSIGYIHDRLSTHSEGALLRLSNASSPCVRFLLE